MIDVDRLEEQLELALDNGARPRRLPRPRPRSVPAPAPVPRGMKPPAPKPPTPAVNGETGEAQPPPATHWDHRVRLITELISSGRIDEADAQMAAAAGSVEHQDDFDARRDVAAWRSMRALIDGRQDDARRGAQEVLVIGRQAQDPRAGERHLALQYWITMEWGNEAERNALLDQCRERAYCYDDLPWRGALTLLLACTGRVDEATREFDITLDRSSHVPGDDPVSVDIVTNLAEAAWVLGDAGRARVLQPQIALPHPPIVVADRGWVCKGSIARFRALVAATMGLHVEAAGYFAEAAETHRNLGARLLVSRTLIEWRRDSAVSDRVTA